MQLLANLCKNTVCNDERMKHIVVVDIFFYLIVAWCEFAKTIFLNTSVLLIFRVDLMLRTSKMINKV